MSLGCVAFDVAALEPHKENKINMHDLDVQTFISNLVEGFNRNFFDLEQQLYSKKLNFSKNWDSKNW